MTPSYMLCLYTGVLHANTVRIHDFNRIFDLLIESNQPHHQHSFHQNRNPLKAFL
jgi:hypothetical protein